MRHTLQREIRKSYWAYIEDIIDYTADLNNDRQTKQTKSGHTLNIFAKILPASLLFEARVRLSVTHHAKPNYLTISSQFSRNNHLPPSLPDKWPSPHPSMPNITISTPGIHKLLANLKPHKATGPDLITPTVFKELSHGISPIPEIIFNISLQTGQVPNDWKEANIAPIFKNGRKTQSQQLPSRSTYLHHRKEYGA